MVAFMMAYSFTEPSRSEQIVDNISDSDEDEDDISYC